MRLAVVESASYGGLLHYAGELADALAARGHDVDLLTARRNELDGRLRHARMRDVLVAPAPRPGELPTGWRYLVRRAGVAGRLALATARTAVELRHGGYDAAILVDDYGVVPTAAGALLIAALPGGPALTAICHEPRPRNRRDPSQLYVRSPVLHRLLSAFYNRLDLVFVHGDRSRRDLAAAWPGVAGAVIGMGHGVVATQGALAAATEERILFFGDWRRAKGLPELLEAFDRVRSRRPAARLTIAGTPTPDGDPDRVRRWAAGHGDDVELLAGYVELEHVPALFARARVVAAPYVAGAQSSVVHLAMSLGRAVVSSDAGDLPEAVLDGQTGLVVPAGDVQALAQALERVLSDEALAARLGAAGRERLQTELSWGRVAALVEQGLAGVLDGRGAG